MNPNSKTKDKLSVLFNFQKVKNLSGGYKKDVKYPTIQEKEDDDIYIKYEKNKKKLNLKDMIANYNPNLETNINYTKMYEIYFNINTDYKYPFIQFIITLLNDKLVFNSYNKNSTYNEIGCKNYKKESFIFYKLTNEDFLNEKNKSYIYIITLFDIINIGSLFNYKIANNIYRFIYK